MVHRQSNEEVQMDGDLFWQRVLSVHSVSGLTVKEFCKNEGLAVWRFYYWRKKLREATQSAPTDEVGFRQVGEVLPSPVELRIEFSDGVLLHIPDHCDPSRLQQVIGLLRECSC